MSKHIIKSTEQIWNERVEECMKRKGFNQKQFAQKYKMKYGTGSQSDVSKWMNVGIATTRNGNKVGFPEFTTMSNIAKLLDVSVAYLIGETDYDSFELERASKYLGISQPAANAIKNLTSGKSVPPFHLYPNFQYNNALNHLLSAEELVPFLAEICNLAESIYRQNNPIDYFEEAVKELPKELQDDAVALWADYESACEQGILPTDELKEAVNKLEYAVGQDMYMPDKIEHDIRSKKYALLEKHQILLSQILTDGNLDSMIPHQLTAEENERNMPFTTFPFISTIYPELSFKIRVPAFIPEGYELKQISGKTKGFNVGSDNVWLYYANGEKYFIIHEQKRGAAEDIIPTLNHYSEIISSTITENLDGIIVRISDQYYEGTKSGVTIQIASNFKLGKDMIEKIAKSMEEYRPAPTF